VGSNKVVESDHVWLLKIYVIKVVKRMKRFYKRSFSEERK
jgi:hypothetical protein